MASNIFSQTTTGEVNIQMITEPVFNQDASSNERLNYPQANEGLMQAIKMHHTKKFQINFSQINPLPIVDETEPTVLEPREGVRNEETSLVHTTMSSNPMEAQLVLSKSHPLNGFNFNGSSRLGDIFAMTTNQAENNLFNPSMPFGLTSSSSAENEVPKSKYGTYIELAKSESRSRLINRSVYVDPSPSGITRIHINHFNTNSSVTERIKEVNEKLFKADDKARLYQRQNDSVAHDSSYISTYKKNSDNANRASTFVGFNNALPPISSNSSNSRVLRFALPNSPTQISQPMIMPAMATQTAIEPIIKLIPPKQNQKYEEIVSHKKDSSTSPFRILESKPGDEPAESHQVVQKHVHVGTSMTSEADKQKSGGQHYRKASILTKTQPTYHEIGTNTTIPTSRLEAVTAEEAAVNQEAEAQRSPSVVIHRKDSIKSRNEIYSKPKVQSLMPRLERSKLIVVNLTPHPELEKLNQISEVNESNQRASFKQMAQTIEEEEEPYPDERIQPHHSDSNQDLHQANKNTNLLTPTSTKSIAQQTTDNESMKKLRSTSDDDNILNGKSSTYYNDIKNKGSEMVSRTDSRRSRHKEKMTKLDFDQHQKSSFNSNTGRSLRRVSYLDENGDEDENNNVLSDDSEINFFNKLRFYRIPHSDGQITENFDYDQEPRVFYTTGKYKRNSSFGMGSLKRLNPIRENDEMAEQLVDPVVVAERFCSRENLWVPVGQPARANPVDEIITLKEDDDEAGNEGEEGKKDKKKKNLKVKIKLPTENFAKLKPKKKRHLQKFCLILFLLTLFVIVTGILLYFFVWGYVQTKN